MTPTPTSNPRWRRWGAAVLDAAQGTVAALTSPPMVVLAFLAGSAASCVLGVYHLAGYGWALLALSAWLAVIATALAKGMRSA